MEGSFHVKVAKHWFTVKRQNTHKGIHSGMNIYGIQIFMGIFHRENSVNREENTFLTIPVSRSLKWSKVLSRILLSLVRPCLFQWNLSCVFIWEESCGFKGSGKLYLVKMNCHVCLTDTYNEISVGMYQRGNVGNKRRANPLTLSWLNSFFPWFLGNFAFLLIIRIVLQLSSCNPELLYWHWNSV